MKTFVVLAVSIVLVSIFFCPIVMAAPSMPDDLQMVQPDPSLPKGLSAFWGKWEFIADPGVLFVIVEKIDEEKASLYIWAPGTETYAPNWTRREGKVNKERGKYIVWYHGRDGNVELSLKGEHLIFSARFINGPFRRVR